MEEKKMLKVIGRTNDWEKLLEICQSRQVVYRGLIEGHSVYSSSYKDDWCVIYLAHF